MLLIKPAKSCTNCHFFHRQHGSDGKQEISPDCRKRTTQGDFSWQREYESLSCYKGIWDGGYNFPESSKHALLVLTKRNACYFLKYQQGMFLNAADTLRLERIATENNLRNYRIAIIGLFATVVGLIVALLAK
jgi:hypothetical protein